MKNKFVLLIVIAVVAFLAYANKDRFLGDKSEDKPQNQNQTQQNGSQQEAEPQTEPESDNTLRGVLKVSNDKSRGNLMLEIADSDQVIYLRSSRDFSALYGKEVVMTIDGDLNGFTLLDIKATN